MSDGQVVLFEDPRVRNFFPLAYTRPLYDLRCGAFTLAEKIVHHFPGAPVSYQCRDYVRRVLVEEDPPRRLLPADADRYLLVNGRVLMDEALSRALRRAPGEVVFRRDREVVAAWMARARYAGLAAQFDVPLGDDAFEGLPEEQLDARLMDYAWDLVGANGSEIARDLERAGGLGERLAAVSTAATIECPEAVRLGRARIDAGAVLDARSGPIWVADRAHIASHVLIEGPAVVGEGSLVRPGASLSGGVTIGPVCKVGGEIATSIVQGYANKQHGGYLGHSYLGGWVNLGSGTETSDLKNNYRPVRVVVNGEPVGTGTLHVGLFMGDHSKSAIGSLFSTGAVVGICCNFFAPSLSPGYLPCFTWQSPEGRSEYELERALLTARRVMERRGLEPTVAYEAMLRTVFDLTIEERQETVRAPA